MLAPFSQQLKIIKLVPILHNIALDLAADGPRDEVLHVPRDQVRGIRDSVRPDPDVALLDELDGGLDGLGHLEAGHDDGEAAAGEGGDGDAVLDGAELGGGRQDAHVVQLVQQQLFGLPAHGVVGREQGEAMGELAERLQ